MGNNWVENTGGAIGRLTNAGVRRLQQQEFAGGGDAYNRFKDRAVKATRIQAFFKGILARLEAARRRAAARLFILRFNPAG